MKKVAFVLALLIAVCLVGCNTNDVVSIERYNALVSDYEELKSDYDELKTDYDALVEENEALREVVEEFAFSPEDEYEKENEPTVTYGIDCTQNGVSVKFVEAYAAKDSYGNDMAVMEFVFRNDNEEAWSFIDIGSVSVYQNGIRVEDYVSLEPGYDWDLQHTMIKDSAEIHVFVPHLVQNSTDEIEIVFFFWDWETGDVNQYIVNTTMK